MWTVLLSRFLPLLWNSHRAVLAVWAAAPADMASSVSRYRFGSVEPAYWANPVLWGADVSWAAAAVPLASVLAQRGWEVAEQWVGHYPSEWALVAERARLAAMVAGDDATGGPSRLVLVISTLLSRPRTWRRSEGLARAPIRCSGMLFRSGITVCEGWDRTARS